MHLDDIQFLCSSINMKTVETFHCKRFTELSAISIRGNFWEIEKQFQRSFTWRFHKQMGSFTITLTYQIDCSKHLCHIHRSHCLLHSQKLSAQVVERKRTLHRQNHSALKYLHPVQLTWSLLTFPNSAVKNSCMAQFEVISRSAKLFRCLFSVHFYYSFINSRRNARKVHHAINIVTRTAVQFLFFFFVLSPVKFIMSCSWHPSKLQYWIKNEETLQFVYFCVVKMKWSKIKFLYTVAKMKKKTYSTTTAIPSHLFFQHE